MEIHYARDANGNIKPFTTNSTRVTLAKGTYPPRKINPVWGSEHACVGLIVGMDITKARCILVKWSNGITNSYNGRDLLVHSEKSAPSNKKNPNLTFKRRQGN